MIGAFEFRNHIFIQFELLSINLYEFMKKNGFKGLSFSLIRRIAIQILQALNLIKQRGVIHCDLKPENILLRSEKKSGIKIIDFGSSCYASEKMYSYIQSRFYRAPEIILGIPYSPAIDIWSLGCILLEFYLGWPIFPGDSETDQLALMMERLGLPPEELINRGNKKDKFFTEENNPILKPNRKGKTRQPGTNLIEDIVDYDCDSLFLSLIQQCLEWDPDERITPERALLHPWILEGLPPAV